MIHEHIRGAAKALDRGGHDPCHKSHAASFRRLAQLALARLLEKGVERELRIESLCVAGGPAQVKALPVQIKEQ